MLKIIVTILVLLIGIISNAQKQEQATNTGKRFNVTVRVNDIENQKGKVLFAIYDSEDHFLKRKYTAVKGAAIKDGTAEVVFENLPPHVYAVTCFHDANENGKLDFSENGMPVEDYGSTNNVFNYGPPQFDRAKFELKDKDLTFEIKFL